MVRPHENQQESGTGVQLRPRRKRKKWLLLAIVAIACSVFFAPSIVTKTGIRNQIVGWFVPDFQGTVHIGSASAGWFQPIVLHDVSVWDATGHPLARVLTVSSTKPLWSLASDPTDLGMFQLHQPELQVTLTESGSNVEDLLQPLLASQPQEDGPAPAAVGLELTVTEGRVLVTDAVEHTSCTVENLGAHITVPKTPPDPLVLRVQAIAQQDASRGDLDLQFTWRQPENITAADFGDGQLHLKSQGFPISAIQPILRRFQAEVDAEGQLVSDLHCQWRRSEQGPILQTAGTIALHQLTLDAPEYLGQDKLHLDRVTAHIDAQTADNLMHVESIRVTSELADIQLQGDALLTELMSNQSAVAKLLDWKSSHQFQLKGHVDLAAVANQLPTLLRLKHDTRVSQGNLAIDLRSDLEAHHRLVQGSLKADNIQALVAGRTVTWDKPIHLAIDSSASDAGLQVQQLQCQADFFQCQASGNLQQGQLTATGDLQKLVSQLGQLCDLSEIDLAGKMSVDGTWNQDTAAAYQSQLKAVITDFSMATPQIPSIREQQISLNLASRGTFNKNQRLQDMQHLAATIKSGEDALVATLRTPVTEPSLETTWPMACELSGRTETWLARLRPLGVSIPGWAVKSGIHVVTDADIHPKRAVFKSLSIDFADVSASAPGWLIREPQVQVRGDLMWEAASNTASSPSLTVSSSSFAIRGEQLQFQASPDTTAASGTFAYRGDVARIMNWQYQDVAPTSRLKGTLEGQAQLSTKGSHITFRSSADVTEFAYELPAKTAVGAITAPLWSPVWHEPQLKLHCEGAYAVDKDALEFRQFGLTSAGLSVAANGSLSTVSSHPHIDLRGEYNYDLQTIVFKLQPLLGKDMRMVGQHRQVFSISGPLTSPAVAVSADTTVSDTQLVSAQTPIGKVPHDLTFSTTLKWDSLDAYGIQLGHQEVQAKLVRGTVLFSPLETTMSQGHVSLTPRIELNATPMALIVEPGEVAENIHITPEMCASWLKYITPILSGAATAEGQFSVSLQGAHVPLAEPTAARAAGRVTIHGGRVQPGPMAQQLLATIQNFSTALNQVAPSLSFLAEDSNWLELTPQTVDYQVSDGRIYHRNLEFASGNVRLRTQGWVGMDQSVGILAEIPILDDWVDDNEMLMSLKGQTLKVPIQGTLSQPQLDRRALAQATQQLVGNTAQQAIQKELKKGLEKGLQQLLGN